MAAVLFFVAASYLNSRASDFWGYSRLGVGKISPDSVVYYLEVRGVGTQPTVVRLVQFPNRAATPSNALDVSHAVVDDLNSHARNRDRWTRHCTLIVGRTTDEKVVVPMDAATARKLFRLPGSQFDDFKAIQKLWDEHVADHLRRGHRQHDVSNPSPGF
ncbi:MAG: hypothetical protein AAGA03_10970 [Planctomycetota bacterium]